MDTCVCMYVCTYVYISNSAHNQYENEIPFYVVNKSATSSKFTPLYLTGTHVRVCPTRMCVNTHTHTHKHTNTHTHTHTCMHTHTSVNTYTAVHLAKSNWPYLCNPHDQPTEESLALSSGAAAETGKNPQESARY